MEPVTPDRGSTGAAAEDAGRGRAARSRSRLVAGDAGDGNEHDFVVWERPRLVAPGRPDLLLRDVRGCGSPARRACASVPSVARPSVWPRRPRRARPRARSMRSRSRERHGVEPAILAAWLDYLGISTDGAAVKIDTPLTGKIDERRRATTS